MVLEDKHNAERFTEGLKIEEGFYLLKFQNDTSDSQKIIRNIDSSFIQFHFNLKGNCKFQFNKGNYELPLNEESSLLLYNPQQDLPLNLVLEPNSWLISLVISIKKFRQFDELSKHFCLFYSRKS